MFWEIIHSDSHSEIIPESKSDNQDLLAIFVLFILSSPFT